MRCRACSTSSKRPSLASPSPAIERCTKPYGFSAELVAFVDDDDVPRPDWLRLLVDRQAATQADIIFGRWEPAGQTALPLDLRLGILHKPAKPDGFVDRFGLPQDASTNNVLMTKRVIISMLASDGLFSPDFALTGGGDHDFFIRSAAMASGLNAVLSPSSMAPGRTGGLPLAAC